jgi:hypothetical protein
MKKLASQISCWVMLLVFVLPAQAGVQALSLADKADKIARAIVQDYAVTSVQYALSDQAVSYCRATAAYLAKRKTA